MAGAPATSPFVEVLVDQKVDKPLCYASENFPLTVGARVIVPLRNKMIKGTVIRLLDQASFAKTASVDTYLEEESLTPDLIQLGQWMRDYYLTSYQKVLTTLLPASLKKATQKEEQYFVERNLSIDALTNLSAELSGKELAQKKVLDALLAHPKGLYLSQLLEKAEVSKSPVDTLVKKKVLLLKKLEIDRSIFSDEDFLKTPPKKLNEEQAVALKKIEQQLAKKTFHTELLFGVTGSGKTEVYLQAIQQARKQNLGVIFLVPEIALTTQTIERVRSRFSEPIAILHSRLSDGERFDAYRGIRAGKISIIIGARSAIFAPVQNLGLIIVDEEQDGSFKQTEEMPCYNAKDIAVVRSKICNAVCVLGSATPSFETYHNAIMGKYGISTLTQRAQHNPLPHVTIVDMRIEDEKKKSRALFSDLLLSKIEDRIAKGEQTLLFLNRRGYYTCQICTECSETLKCTQCDVSLTFHKGEDILACHLCGITLNPKLARCGKCNTSESMRFRGPGTEQVERAIHAIFPGVRTIRMDRDTTRHKGSHDTLYRTFKSHKADILIGTQMIAKGLDFPAVTLVGILNADSMLHVPDFRATELGFQLLSQVAGRAGRGDFPGEVILQTRLPEYPVIQYASKEAYRSFFDEELEVRKQFRYPPFAKMVRLLFKSADLNLLERYGHYLSQALEKQKSPEVDLFPYTPCGLTRAKGEHRGQILLKAPRFAPLQKLLSSLTPPPKIRLNIDVDPKETFF